MVKTERFTSLEYINILILILRLVSVSGAVIWAIIPQLYIVTPNILHIIFVYNLIIAVYVLFFIVCFFFPEGGKRTAAFFFVSFLFDEVVIAYFIYNTGGSSSPFYSGYFVVITLSAFMLGTRLALLVALFGIATFIVSQTYYGLGLYNAIELFYRTFPLIIIAFPPALLSDALKRHAEQINRLNEKLRKKNEELENSLKQIERMQKRLLEGEKERAMLELTESIAHRLRNPIMSIGGMAELLERKMEKRHMDKELKKYADYIKTESRKLSMLSDNLLQMSSTSLNLKPVSLQKVIRELIEEFKDRLRRNNIGLKIGMDETVEPVVVDEERLRIALRNIMDNSIESMKESGELRISLKRNSREGRDVVEIEIADTGGGMSQETLESLFKPFESGGDVKKGIGLPIARHSIEMMGGRLEVASQIGKGTKFRIILQAKREV